MLRKIVARKNRTYNHGRKVGLGRLTLECGHEVGHLMARNPVVGGVAHCSKCDRDETQIVTDCVRVKKGQKFELCPRCKRRGVYVQTKDNRSLHVCRYCKLITS